MNIAFWVIGKTDERYLQTGIQKYLNRLKHYCKFEYTEWKDVKTIRDSQQLKEKEGHYLLSKINSNDFVILLDEKGDSFSSKSFAIWIDKKLRFLPSKAIFIVAGAYGASNELKNRANAVVSLSKMTFSHQMIRLFFVEQLYRSFTILRNEKYHNE